MIESEKLCLRIAESLKRTCEKLGVIHVFKASYDKANRTSARSFRGPGIDEGLKILTKIRSELGVPVLTDVHTEEQATTAGEVVDTITVQRRR